MKKIVFVTLMMADDMHKRHYPVDGNSFNCGSNLTKYVTCCTNTVCKLKYNNNFLM